ncbi:MAG: sulfite exporter TauE/SafE family protein [Actinomycetaceae bacterium]|nr:sulfite exporter TauE/SafE family protein [Actinomycetaceae bacterium]
MAAHLIAISLVLAVIVGVSIGLLGGGGSILTVPILTYVLGMPAQEAIAASLFIVGTTSIVGTINHARAGRVRFKTGVLFGIAGMVGAFGGGFLGGFIPGVILMVLFALMMIATATPMIRGRKNKDGTEVTPKDGEMEIFKIVLDGLAVGFVTGLVGAGGGFLIVPVLNMLGGLPMAVAVGTSLLVISMKSFAGLGGYLFSVSLNWPIVLAFTGVAIIGSFIGTALAGKVPEKSLRKGFGYFVLLMGFFVLIQEVPSLISSFAG